MELRSDIALLTAIAKTRDQDAFAEFHERYQKRAINLAFRILRNLALAEDAVQEAMLSIWCSPSSSLPTGDTEDWIMRIVMHKSLDLKRGRRRSTLREDCISVGSKKQETEFANDIEDKQLIAALRGRIDQLPDLERWLLACCYCTSMSHRELAKLVGVSQPTVSTTIRQVLDRLRTDLTKAGVVAVVPLINAENLFEAMTTGSECPAGMTGRLMQRIESYEKAARSVSRRMEMRRGAKPMWLGATVALVAVGIIWHVMSGSKPTLPDANGSQIGATSERIQAPTADIPYSHTWNFNSREQADDFKVTQGSWVWVANGGSHGLGCMETQGERFMAELKIPIEKMPLMTTFRAKIRMPIPAGGEHMLLAAWSSYKSRAIFNNVGRPARSDENTLCTMRQYLTRSFSDNWTGGQRSSLFMVERAEGSKLTILARGGYQIDELTICEITPQEVPDIHEYLDAFEKIEPSKRNGTVVLPELKSARPGKPVTLTFFSPLD
jgi:RNA polymerase sigma-70 factor (ECF subfamily)